MRISVVAEYDDSECKKTTPNTHIHVHKQHFNLKLFYRLIFNFILSLFLSLSHFYPKKKPPRFLLVYVVDEKIFALVLINFLSLSENATSSTILCYVFTIYKKYRFFNEFWYCFIQWKTYEKEIKLKLMMFPCPLLCRVISSERDAVPSAIKADFNANIPGRDKKHNQYMLCTPWTCIKTFILAYTRSQAKNSYWNMSLLWRGEWTLGYVL